VGSHQLAESFYLPLVPWSQQDSYMGKSLETELSRALNMSYLQTRGRVYKSSYAILPHGAQTLGKSKLPLPKGR